jgi:RNA-directed DNA polymerase
VFVFTWHRNPYLSLVSLSILAGTGQSWANARHLNKSKRWIAQKYWHVDDGNGWQFADQEGTTLWRHTQTHIQRHAKVRGRASPYDGNLLYWSQRLQTHSMLNGMLAKLLQRQQGKCRWCGLLFQPGDLLEVDHLTPKSQGGSNEISNRTVLHRHCHDQRHARNALGTYDKGHIVEELDDAKGSCPVLKPSKGGNSFT